MILSSFQFYDIESLFDIKNPIQTVGDLTKSQIY